MSGVTAWKRLSGHERAALAEAVLQLGLARARVALRPFRDVARAASRTPAGPHGDSASARRLVAWAVTAAARRAPWRAKCLEQGLAAQAMLRRRGVEAVLHYGLKRGEIGDLDAHVWVTAGGCDVVGGALATGYVEMARFPDRGTDG
ncbi:MAG: lasso peptide biosynthesis B2 protein [Brevundimonas sp.]